MEKKMNNKGFSLVELIVVIAIMAVLVGVLAPQFIKYVEKSRESTDITNLDSIKQVVEAYFADKEGTDLPNTATIAMNATSKEYELSFNSGYSGTVVPANVLSQGGVQNTKVKGAQWDASGTPQVVWDLQNNTWTYSASSKYYKVNNSNPNNSIVPE